MKNKKAITILVIIIAVFSVIAASAGVFSGRNQVSGQYQFQSLHGETVDIYGRGLYRNDSVSVAAQGISQDIVTMALGIPLLLASLLFAQKNLLKGQLLLTGTLGYFLYSYTSYSFLAMYNPLFLVYVVLMSASLFAFILCIASLDKEALKNSISSRLPVKLIGGFQLFIAFMLFMMWLGRIVPSLLKGSAPIGLEHYTTLVIQALDLGIIVPAAALSGVMIIRKKPIGYLLSSVIIIKGLMMLTALTAMIIGMISAGVEVSAVEIIVFPIFNLIAVFCLAVLLRSIDEKTYISRVRDYSA